jgi:outer membrane protein OmpA-like peptidoglycan-associated protein
MSRSRSETVSMSRFRGVIAAAVLMIAATAPPAGGQAPAGRSDQPTGKVLDISGNVLDIVGLASEVKAIDLGIPGSRVTVTPKEVRIELPADILFDFDKSNIRPSAADALKKAAALLHERAKGVVRIEGHTDSKGNPPYNQKLSERRAESVRLWLVEREGLSNIKFATQGFGATRPKVPNTKPGGSDDPDGRQINRRVEIVFGTG